MPISSDFSELLSIFNEFQVRYLVAGGYAVMKYTEPRFTKDLDLWTDPDSHNAELVFHALARFGAPLARITVQDFMDPGTIYQLGVYPIRVDIHKALAGLQFEAAWQNKVPGDFGGVPVFFLGRDDLVTTKRLTGRDQDRIDVRRLTRKRGSKKRRP